ncbi:SDR family oxidoreductase [bacterium]|nr:SDR family oxidoreductase [bacterium]
MLKGRVAIITGAGRGIGQATADLFSRQGASVVVCDIDSTPCQDTVTSILEQGGMAVPCVGDVLEDGFAQKAIDTAVKAFESGVDIIVNNAGYGGKGFVDETSDSFWGNMLDINTTAPFRLIRAVTPLMKQSAKSELEAGKTPVCRKIINVSSIAGTDGLVASAAYATSKAAIEGLTRSVAKDLGHFNICVNAVSFGLIKTRLSRPIEANKVEHVGEKVMGFPAKFLNHMVGLTPLGRVGTVEEAAGAILMLASPYADFITGQVLKVSGGL